MCSSHHRELPNIHRKSLTFTGLPLDLVRTIHQNILPLGLKNLRNPFTPALSSFQHLEVLFEAAATLSYLFILCTSRRTKEHLFCMVSQGTGPWPRPPRLLYRPSFSAGSRQPAAKHCQDTHRPAPTNEQTNSKLWLNKYYYLDFFSNIA